MTMPGHIIFLNGPSSSGKTSLARLLQHQLSEPYLHMALDTFLGMFPSHWAGRKTDGHDEIAVSPPDAVLAIYRTPLAQRLISGYHRALAGCAGAGNHLIVDHVLLERQWLDECLTLLNDSSVFFVGLHCAVDVLEARERERGDRAVGLARAQIDRVHAHAFYDLELDTSLISMQECAMSIEQALRHPPAPSAFQRLRNSL